MDILITSISRHSGRGGGDGVTITKPAHARLLLKINPPKLTTSSVRFHPKKGGEGGWSLGSVLV